MVSGDGLIFCKFLQADFIGRAMPIVMIFNVLKKGNSGRSCDRLNLQTTNGEKFSSFRATEYLLFRGDCTRSSRSPGSLEKTLLMGWELGELTLIAFPRMEQRRSDCNRIRRAVLENRGYVVTAPHRL